MEIKDREKELELIKNHWKKIRDLLLKYKENYSEDLIITTEDLEWGELEFKEYKNITPNILKNIENKIINLNKKFELKNQLITEKYQKNIFPLKILNFEENYLIEKDIKNIIIQFEDNLLKIQNQLKNDILIESQNEILQIQKKQIDIENKRQESIKNFTLILAIGVITNLFYTFIEFILKAINSSETEISIFLIGMAVIYVILFITIVIIIQNLPTEAKRKFTDNWKNNKKYLIIFFLLLILGLSTFVHFMKLYSESTKLEPSNEKDINLNINISYENISGILKKLEKEINQTLQKKSLQINNSIKNNSNINLSYLNLSLNNISN